LIILLYTGLGVDLQSKKKKITYHNTVDVARVDIVAMNFDKEVVPWFHMLHT